MLGQGGLIAPPGDPETFAAKLAELVRNEDLRGSLGAAGRARASSVFRWSRTVDHLEAAYHRAISRSAEGVRRGHAP
jgi:glycosyltransferase involved in cell wall biosynthesis